MNADALRTLLDDFTPGARRAFTAHVPVWQQAAVGACVLEAVCGINASGHTVIHLPALNLAVHAEIGRAGFSVLDLCPAL